MAAPAQSPARVINLVDYIGTDYRGAVGPEGQVLNPEELQEMRDFSSAARVALDQLTLDSAPAKLQGLREDLVTLESRIAALAPPDEIAQRSSALKMSLIQTFGVATWPRHMPVRAEGERMYQATCSSCHGADGRADTPMAAKMLPAPRAFTDVEVMGGLSPFKAFNVMTFGVQGTSMPSFQGLPDSDRWNLAFELFRFRFDEDQARRGAERFSHGGAGPLATLKVLSTTPDSELLAKLAQDSRFPDANAQLEGLAWLRREAVYAMQDNPIQVASRYLTLSLKLYQEGDTAGAYQAAVDSYLEGFENAESALGAIDRESVSELERRYGKYRDAIQLKKPVEQVVAQARDVQLKLEQAESRLSGGQTTAGLAFLQSFAIIGREGLEAALLIAALLAFLGKSGNIAARRYIHLGTGAAVVAGFATWWAAFSLIRISGAGREMLEGITSTLAAVMLFYVSYWLHSRSEAAKWVSYLKDKVSQSLSGGNVAALSLLAFLAVYREAFEIVLFYHALLLSAADQQAAIWAGLATGVLVLIVLITAIFKLGLKLPLKQFFRFTSAFMYLLSFVLLGHGLRQLQLAGVVSYTPLELPSLPLLGIYASVETLVGQTLVALLFIGYLVFLSISRTPNPPQTA